MEQVLELDELSSVEELVLGKTYKGSFEKGRMRLNKLVAGIIEGAPALAEGALVVAKLVGVTDGEPVFIFIRSGEAGAEAGAERVEKQFFEKTTAQLRGGEPARVVGKLVCVVKAGIDKGFLLDGTGAAVVEATELEEGTFVEAFGKTRTGLPPVIAAEKVNKIDEQDVEEVGKKIQEHLKKFSEPGEFRLFVRDEVMEKLYPMIRECARFLKQSLLEFRPIVMRYHGDADGVCSALLVFSALKRFLSAARVSLEEHRFLLSTRQTDSAIYSQNDLAKDIERAALLPKKPVFVFLDHAANEESIEQLRKLKESGFEPVVVDHHPPAQGIEGVAGHFVSPFLAGGSCHYTTGLICFELAKAIAGEAEEKLAHFSLQGDKSVFSSGEFKEPRVIDYLATYNSPESLEFYESALSDAKKINYYFEEANRRINRAVAASKPFTSQKKIGSSTLVVVRLDKFCKKGEYPSKGSVLNEIHKTFSGPVVSIGYGGDAIIFRASHQAFEAGFRASHLISQLKQELPHAVVSGGGHDVAASMRVKEEFLQSVLDRALELAGEKLSKPEKISEKHALCEIIAEEGEAKVQVEEA